MLVRSTCNLSAINFCFISSSNNFVVNFKYLIDVGTLYTLHAYSKFVNHVIALDLFVKFS